jgi:DNA-binding transcriptional ArsR family regulator
MKGLNEKITIIQLNRGYLMKNCQITMKSSLINEFRESILDNNQFETYTGKFKALSDPTRLKILYALKYGELYVCEIIMVLNKPQSTISHHLNVLKNAGFIKSHKDGIWIKYELKNQDIIRIVEMITE